MKQTFTLKIKYISKYVRLNSHRNIKLAICDIQKSRKARSAINNIY